MERNIRLLKWYMPLSRSILIIPVIVPYFHTKMGLTFQQFLLGETIFAISLVILEVPSGWLSDVWSRRATFFASACAFIIAYLFLIFGTDFTDVALAQIAFGFAISLASGTDSAFLYDSLLAIGKQHDYKKHEGQLQAYGFYATATSALVGGFLYEIYHELPNIISIVCCLIAIGLTFLMTEPVRVKKEPEHHPLKDMMLTMRYALHGHAEVALIIILSATLFAGTKLLMWQQQPYYMAMHLPESLFGILMACGYGMAGVASHVNHLLSKRLTHVGIMAFAWIIVIFVCVGAGIHVGWNGVLLLMFGGSFIYGMCRPHVQAAINSRVDSSRRATILSTANLLSSLLFVPLSLVVGWAVTHHGIQYGLLTLIIWLCISGTLFAFIRRRNRV